MKGFITVFSLFLVALAVSEVCGQYEEQVQEVEATELDHGHRSKRSPYDPSSLVAPLILGKSFLLGSLLGPKIFRGPPRHYGWGYPVRSRSYGWGYRPRSHISVSFGAGLGFGGGHDHGYNYGGYHH